MQLIFLELLNVKNISFCVFIVKQINQRMHYTDLRTDELQLLFKMGI